MNCGGIDPGNAYLWLSLCGIFAGGGLSFFAAPRRRINPTVFIVFTGIAVMFLLVSFSADGFSLANLRFKAYWLAVSAGIGYAGFFFGKAVGIPVLFVSVILTSLVWYSFYDWQCAPAGTEVCSFRIISEGEDFIRIQYETPDGTTSTTERLTGGTVRPALDVIILPEYFFILKNRSIYRFSGFCNETDISAATEKKYNPVTKGIISLPDVIVPVSPETVSVAPGIGYRLILNKFGKAETIKFIE